MKSCEMTKMLSAYQDGELAPEIIGVVQEHIKHCPQCAEELRQLESIILRIKDIDQTEPDPRFNAQIMAEIKNKSQYHLKRFPSVIYSSVFLLFFLLGVLFNLIPTNKTIEKKDNNQMIEILIQSQSLNLINIQDKTFAVLYNEDNNE